MAANQRNETHRSVAGILISEDTDVNGNEEWPPKPMLEVGNPQDFQA